MPDASRKRKFARLAVEIAIIAAIFFAFRAWQTRDAVKGAAPELAGMGADGALIELARAPGEPVLVHFWATWCGVCRAEEGTIDALADDHRVITIATQSGGAAEVGRYLSERGLDFPTVVDPHGEIARRWGVSAFPTSFVIDADGAIRNIEVGYTTSLGLRARLALARN